MTASRFVCVKIQSDYMRKTGQFAKELVKQWGTLVTSGALIGALGIWQGLGHAVRPSIYWAVALVGFLAGSYRVWLNENAKSEREKTALDHERSLHGGPEISFKWGAVGPLNTRKTLVLENSGAIDAYEVKIGDIGINKNHCGARFPVIAKCPKGSLTPLRFELYGDSVPQHEKDNLEMVVYASRSDIQKHAQGDPVVELPITAAFEEYGGAKYEAMFRLVADPYLSDVNIHRISRRRIPSEM